jgi:hypothetical protein
MRRAARVLDTARIAREARGVIASRSKRLACTLALLLGAMQPLLSSPARAVAILASHGHGHEVSVVADAGHVDLVLSHVPKAHARHGAERHLHAVAASEGEHVLHLTGADPGRDSSRRVADAPVVGFAWHDARSPEPRAHTASMRERVTLAPALVRSVVLRI